MRLLLFGVLSLILINAGKKDSGGFINPLQAKYDVKFYELNLKIDPADSSISGNTIIEALITEDLNKVVLNLLNNFRISRISEIKNSGTSDLIFNHTNGLITIDKIFAKNEIIRLRIEYSGKPPVSFNPPWDDGFVWKTTPQGKPFLGVACETEGADVWFPCKDHSSDEPDSVSINLTLPSNLTCIANGRDKGATVVDNNWKTWHWYVSVPINNYNITFYAAPYSKIEYDYTSITGEKIPFSVWVLTEKYNTVKDYCKIFTDEMQFMEKICGPYPARNDKYSVVHSPYLGMEHQSVIAYGSSFKANKYGFDWLHLHELAHEWWGNLITAKNWRDAWIHEGFATYMEALRAESIGGKTSLVNYVNNMFYMNYSEKYNKPVVPSLDVTAHYIFSDLSGSLIYFKGAAILHNLRYLMGDDKFFLFLKKCCYPTDELEKIKTGKQYRLVTSDDIIATANSVYGSDISWYFNFNLKQAIYPVLSINRIENDIVFNWNTNGLTYNMPIDVIIDGKFYKVSFANNQGRLSFNSTVSNIVVDPDNWLLKSYNNTVSNEPESRSPEKFDTLISPNPFNPGTNVKIMLPEKGEINIRILNPLGQLVKESNFTNVSKGEFSTYIDLINCSSGIYFAYITAECEKNRYSNVAKLVLNK